MEKKPTGMTRRRFMKTAGLTGVAAGAATVLGHLHHPEAHAALDVNYISVYESVMQKSGRMYGKAATSPGPAGPIGFENGEISNIVETENYDIVVVGAGITGMIAALKAASMGHRVVVLEKMNAGRGIFESFAAINSTILREANLALTDKEKTEFIREIYDAADWRLRRGPVHTFMERSGEAADFMEAMFQAGPNGLRTVPYGPSIPHECRFSVPAAVPPGGGSVPTGREGLYVVRELATVATTVAPYSNYCSMRYLTPAVQLIRENDGPVTGVIAKDARGYLQFNASKGVILATGGYDSNPEMLQAYCRSEDYCNLSWWNGHFGPTGDGHMMGMKVGAGMDSVPHPIMSFSIASLNSPWKFIKRADMLLLNSPFQVNSAGKRFMDESFGIDYTSYKVNATAAQENFGRDTWQIGNAIGNSAEVIAQYEAVGALKQADTLYDLAVACGIDPEGLAQTAADWERYCIDGLDLEFGRTLTAANSLGSGPYYAFNPSCGFMLATVGGLQINENCNVLDVDDKPIEGLYAGGNASGGFFSGHYPRHISGVSIGRAFTFGYVAAEHASNR